MVSLRQLHYFVAAARAGSATRAAQTLHVSQPSISAAIRDLEAEFGKALFERRQARGLGLTAFGVSKLTEARDILNRLDHLTSNTEAESKPTLLLGYFSTVGPTCVPGILARLAHDLPDIHVDLCEYDLEALSKSLKNGIVDLAISYDIGLPNEIARDVLAEFAPHAVLPPCHPLAGQPEVSLFELAQLPFILIDLPLSRDFLMVPFWQQGLSPTIVLRTGSVEMVRGMVANGLGVSMLFTRPRHDLTHDGKPVVCLPISDGNVRQRLVVAYAAPDLLTVTGKAALASIRDHFSGPNSKWQRPEISI